MLADSRREPVEIVQRSLQADHTTLWRWVQRYGPELAEGRAVLSRPPISVSMRPPP